MPDLAFVDHSEQAGELDLAHFKNFMQIISRITRCELFPSEIDHPLRSISIFEDQFPLIAIKSKDDAAFLNGYCHDLLVSDTR